MIILNIRECSLITGGGDGSKSGGPTKIIEVMVEGVQKIFDLIRGVYKK